MMNFTGMGGAPGVAPDVAVPHVSDKTVCICDTQPVTAEGIRTLLSGCPDLKFLEGTDSLNRALELMRRSAPDVLMLDKAFGIQAILEWLSALRSVEAVGEFQAGGLRTGIVVWGVSVTEGQAPAAYCGRQPGLPRW